MVACELRSYGWTLRRVCRDESVGAVAHLGLERHVPYPQATSTSPPSNTHETSNTRDKRQKWHRDAIVQIHTHTLMRSKGGNIPRT